MTMIVATTGPRVLAAPRRAVPRSSAPMLPQLLRFAVVGCLGTAVTTVLYLLLRTWWDAVPADLVALACSTVVSTEVNRRFTFGGATVDRTRESVQNAATVAVSAFSSSAALLVLAQLVADPTTLQESLAMAGASVLGGLARFAVLRNWVFGARTA